MKTKKIIIILSLLVVVLIAVSIYFYLQSKGRVKDASGQSQAETKALIEKVGKLIVLPEDEIPTVATVSDPEKLKDQPFFVDAKTGDKVLIYTNAKKAILYDPVANKIITIAPINIGQKETQEQQAGLEN